MHIQQIEIDNFKSFSNRTVIPFERGFTTVSGPNGSGKSNIIDSILFCLGLSTSRTMRAEKLTDLINNLSKRREASVSIIFGNNQDIEEEKIVVTRKIKDAGASGYGSTYYLNGRVATLTEIHERLGQHNISPGAYNVLMQGDVTGIINMTALERRKIIDEIAGVAEFDRKIDQAQKELASVASSTERFNILLDELKTRVGQLAEEREQALKYQELKGEKHRYEGMLISAKYLDLKKAYQAAEQNIVDARKHKASLVSQVTMLEGQIEKTRTELAGITAEVKRKGEDQQIALKKQIEGLKGAISRKKDSMQFGQQKKQEHLLQVERAHEEIERLKAKIEDIGVSLEAYEQQQAEIQTKLKTEQNAHDKLLAEYQALMDETGTLGDDIVQTREALHHAEDALAGLNRKKLDVESELERKTREKTYLEDREAQSGSRYQEVIVRIQALEKTIKDLELEKTAFESQVQQQQLTVAKTRVALNTATSELNELHREFTRLDAQKRAYDEMGLGRSVDTVLNAGIKGVHGTLAQLGTVDEDYAVALEIALGGRMKSIVVDNDSVAQDGIELLQHTKAGRATFLPLNKMRDKSHLPLLSNDDGIIDYAINLMNFDKKYDAIFAYALSDTVIVEDINVARKYLRKYRMVTLDGSLFEKTGAITGGSQNPQVGGKLASGKLDQQLAVLRDKLEAKDIEKEKLERKLTADELKLDALKDDFSRFLTQSQRDELEFETLNRELDQLQAVRQEDDAMKTLTDTIKTIEQNLKAVCAEIDSAQLKVDMLTAKLSEMDSHLPMQELERLKSEMADIEFQMKTYEAQSRNVAGEVQSKQLEKEFQEKGIQSYQDQIEQIKVNNDAIDKEKYQLLEEIQLIDKQIEGLEIQAGEMDEELQKLQEQREAVQARLIQEEQQKYQFTRDQDLIEEQILSYQSRKKELQPEIEIAEAELKLADLDPETVTAKDLPSHEEITKNIQRVDKKMEAMGAVNMRAIEEYDAVMQRHQELEEKINTLTHEKEDLTIKIQGYGELKLNAFMTAFDNVNRNFQEIFAELSDGEGHLVLTNAEDPFSGGLTIEARPRDKKMQRLEAMSGGEKSLTALAFVFSFQRYMPAPFYAFDEVDMFLDGINAEKLAQMVKKQSDGAQFIVVSLRKPMLSSSDRTVGVTQKRDGISKVTGVVLRHAS